MVVAHTREQVARQLESVERAHELVVRRTESNLDVMREDLLTVLDVDEVFKRMTEDDLHFIKHMLQTSRSRTGFMNDIEHHVDNLDSIPAPVLVIYSLNDRTVSWKNAQRIADEVPNYKLYAVPSDTHLIWIGSHARAVWQKRLAFLRS